MEERKWTKVESAVKGSNAANPLAIVDDDIVVSVDLFESCAFLTTITGFDRCYSAEPPP